MLPLYKVLRLRGFSLNATLLTLLLYIVGPAQIFSSHYGFHENVFLGLGIFSLGTSGRPANRSESSSALAVTAAKEDAFITSSPCAVAAFRRISKIIEGVCAALLLEWRLWRISPWCPPRWLGWARDDAGPSVCQFDSRGRRRVLRDLERDAHPAGLRLTQVFLSRSGVTS